MLFDDKLSDIIKTLENDGLLLHPTDTIWGLACSPLSSIAIDKIYELKQRDRSKPLILIVDSIRMLKKYVPHLHPRIETLLHFHKKPLTVVYPDAIKLPSYALAKNGSAAIRIINDPYCSTIIQMLGTPLISTSANLSNQPFPKSFFNISKEIVNGVDFVAKHKRDLMLNGKPSVLISYNAGGEINFLRL